MKKYLCMLLSAFLLFSSVCFVCAEDSTEAAEAISKKAEEPIFIEDLIGAAYGLADSKTELLTEQIDILKAVYPEMKIYEDLESEMSRADFLVMLAQLTAGTGYPLYTDFGDVDSENIALLDSLGYAVTAGLVSKSDSFRPDDAISYHEMFKMGVVTCGYESVALRKGGWPGGYVGVAHEIGLSDYLEDSNGSVSAKDAYRLLYNVITVSFLEQTVFGAEERFEIEKGKSILEDKYDMRIIEGIVYANQMTTLTKELSSKAKSTITIGTSTYNNKTDKNLLGYNVRAFLYDEGGANELVTLRKYRNNEVFVSEFAGMDGFTLNAVMPDGSIEEYDLYKGYSTILNDIAAPYAKLSDYSGRSDVTINLIDNDTDGKFDVVKIYTWQYMQVERIDTVNKLIFDANAPSNALEISDSDAEYKFYDCTDGVITKISFSDLSADDILTYIVSANLKSVVAFRSRAKVMGTYTAKNADDNTITVNDREYKLSVYANENFSHLSLGSETTLSLDATGRVVCVSQLDGAYRYGWIVASNKDKKVSFDSDVTVKMFTQSGKMEFFPVAERIYIDNEPQDTKDFYKLEQELVDDRFVKYGLNADGELNMVDFPKAFSGGIPFAENLPERDSFTLYYDGYYGKQGAGAFGDKFMADTGTIFFSVPVTKRLEDEAYVIKSYNSFRNGGVTLKAYDIKPGVGPKVALVFSDSPSTALDEYSGAEVVLDIIEGLDKDGLPATLVKTYDGTNYKSYSPREDVDISKVMPGDIIRISTYKNEIYKDPIIDYSFNSNELDASVIPNSGQIKNLYYKGYVYSYGTRMVQLWDTINLDAEITLDKIYGLDFREQNVIFVDIYKNPDGSVKKAMARFKPLSEIRDYLHSGSEADFMVARMNERNYVKKWIYRVVEQ